MHLPTDILETVELSPIRSLSLVARHFMLTLESAILLAQVLSAPFSIIPLLHSIPPPSADSSDDHSAQ